MQVIQERTEKKNLYIRRKTLFGVGELDQLINPLLLKPDDLSLEP